MNHDGSCIIDGAYGDYLSTHPSPVLLKAGVRRSLVYVEVPPVTPASGQEPLCQISYAYEGLIADGRHNVLSRLQAPCCFSIDTADFPFAPVWLHEH